VIENDLLLIIIVYNCTVELYACYHSFVMPFSTKRSIFCNELHYSRRGQSSAGEYCKELQM